MSAFALSLAARPALSVSGARSASSSAAAPSSARHARATVVVQCAQLPDRRVEEAAATPAAARRSVLFAAAAAALTATTTLPAMAYSKTELCVADGNQSEELGDACRQNLLNADKDSLNYDQQRTVGAGTKVSKSAAAPGASGRATDLSAYQRETLALAEEIDAVLALDLYDASREGRIKQLKGDCNKWASLYAPDGSSKTASGRTFYNAVNQARSSLGGGRYYHPPTALRHLV